jgi:hypothetical protein
VSALNRSFNPISDTEKIEIPAETPDACKSPLTNASHCKTGSDLVIVTYNIPDVKIKYQAANRNSQTGISDYAHFHQPEKPSGLHPHIVAPAK